MQQRSELESWVVDLTADQAQAAAAVGWKLVNLREEDHAAALPTSHVAEACSHRVQSMPFSYEDSDGDEYTVPRHYDNDSEEEYRQADNHMQSELHKAELCMLEAKTRCSTCCMPSLPVTMGDVGHVSLSHVCKVQLQAMRAANSERLMELEVCLPLVPLPLTLPPVPRP